MQTDAAAFAVDAGIDEAVDGEGIDGEGIDGDGGPVELITVGIDIGSATTQISFSRLELEQVDARILVSRRVTLYESDVVLTPYHDAQTIDTAALRRFFDAQYARAGITSAAIDSGAVILTGLALAKDNSRRIADIFAAQAGKLVAVSAGDAIEARLAAQGAGVEALSLDMGAPITHIDIGGGTTKLCHVAGGHVTAIAAIDVGARLIVFDEAGRVARVEEPARVMLDGLGLAVAEGEPMKPAAVTALARYAARQVLAHAGVLPGHGRDAWLLRTGPLLEADAPAGTKVTFSGGVSEYIYQREDRSFGDLGKALAAALAEATGTAGIDVVDLPRGIRATVLGASQYSIQVSGATVWAAATSALPIRNVPVVQAPFDLRGEHLDAVRLASALRRELDSHEASIETDAVAIAVAWSGPATYERLHALAAALASAGRRAGADERVTPLVVACDADIAGLLGRHIREVSDAVPAICVDGVRVGEFDYLDIGSFIRGTTALPVVVKSLLFPERSVTG